MKTQAAERSRAQRRMLAEYLSGKQVGSEPVTVPQSAFCGSTDTPFRALLTGPSWNSWGAEITNTRFQSGDAAGMTARDVPRLKLNGVRATGREFGGNATCRAGGRIYVGGAEGDLFVLDAKSGCIYWHIEVEAGIRSAITLESGAVEG